MELQSGEKFRFVRSPTLPVNSTVGPLTARAILRDPAKAPGQQWGQEPWRRCYSSPRDVVAQWVSWTNGGEKLGYVRARSWVRVFLDGVDMQSAATAPDACGEVATGAGVELCGEDAHAWRWATVQWARRDSDELWNGIRGARLTRGGRAVEIDGARSGGLGRAEGNGNWARLVFRDPRSFLFFYFYLFFSLFLS
jgi:hypothetical protein